MEQFIEKHFPNENQIFVNLSDRLQGSQTFYHTASANLKGVYNIAMSDNIPKSIEDVVS